jgi:8-oxo-dGTP pyrophosphatase MutT (NUDIX family)
LITRADWRQKIREILSSRHRQIVCKEGYRKSAVLIPIYENKGEQYFVLTKRAQGVMYHKGQISFPGGAYDKEDGELKVTALREAYEEIGISPDDVEILGNLDDQATYTSRFVITPFVGAIPYPVEFKVNHREVEELIQAPVSALLIPSAWVPQTTDDDGKSYPWGHYLYGNHKITGITARMLKQLIDLVFV